MALLSYLIPWRFDLKRTILQLAHPDKARRKAAKDALARKRPDWAETAGAKDTIPMLEKLARSDDRKVAGAARIALDDIACDPHIELAEANRYIAMGADEQALKHVLLALRSGRDVPGAIRLQIQLEHRIGNRQVRRGG